ncbi:hypothetical protein I3843_01G026100 [Carya illinoinensis]|nr:hypothetical protein I3843_01G026100 [Carya illinoinensis]
MCFRVDCKQCGKYSWGGIDEGKHCMCRSWPGVVIPSKDANTKLPLQGSSCSSTKEK